MNKIRAIVVGLGNQSISDHVPALLRREDIEIIGACDPNKDAQESFAAMFLRLQQPLITDGIDELLQDVHPDIAVVAVPHDKYIDIIAKLCHHEIYILKEKPLARNKEEACALLSIQNFKKFCFITTQRRYSSMHNRAKEALSELGELYLYHVVYKLNVDAPDADWRGRRSSAGGGCLIDMGYHMIDQLTWWFGMPEKIHAQISSLAVPDSKYDAEDSASVSFGYNTGMHGTLLISRAAGAKREEYEVYGSKGYLIGSKKELAIYDRTGLLLRRESLDNSENMLDAQLEFFLSRVKHGGTFFDIQRYHFTNMLFIERCYEDAMRKPLDIHDGLSINSMPDVFCQA